MAAVLSPASAMRSTPSRSANQSSAAGEGRVLPSSTWLTYSLEKREPPSSPCVSPISSRASRTRAPTPVARSRRVTPRAVSSVFVSPIPLKVADSGSLD